MTKEEKLQKIYKVIWPTHFWFISQDWWYSWNNIEHVMIWDVLDWIGFNASYIITLQKWCLVNNQLASIFKVREYKRKPIDDNSNAIDYVLSLIESVE